MGVSDAHTSKSVYRLMGGRLSRPCWRRTKAFPLRVRPTGMALHTLPRRQFVGSLAALLGVGTGGCTNGLGGSTAEDTPVEPECEREHQELPDLRLRNRDSEPHTVEFAVAGERTVGTNGTIYEERFDLGPDTQVENPDAEAVVWVAFDPDEDDIEQYDDFRATATSGDGQTDSSSVYSTVVGHPLRYGIRVEIRQDRGLSISEMHVDVHEGWDPAC